MPGGMADTQLLASPKQLMYQLCEEKKGKINEKSFKKDSWRVDEQLLE